MVAHEDTEPLPTVFREIHTVYLVLRPTRVDSVVLIIALPVCAWMLAKNLFSFSFEHVRLESCRRLQYLDRCSMFRLEVQRGRRDSVKQWPREISCVAVVSGIPSCGRTSTFPLRPEG
ncbi:hypothetical protein ARMGADRAFT_771969 [Armillaria gallica]|uniref:Uncharacterized protein n=1 Tax=Armillaria gallica TaxID=47427 RepID=A0A2H3CFK0_ARMGA|nr:hypothetical protein ARMGADRAFT_771969 [Armillaria gallica]